VNITAIIEKADTSTMKESAKYNITRCWLITEKKASNCLFQVSSDQSGPSSAPAVAATISAA